MVDLTNGPNLGLLINGDKGADHYVELMKMYRGLDGLVQPRVLTWGGTAPPGSPSNGDCHIPGVGATGAWSGHAHKIVRYFSVGEGGLTWEVFTPKQGWRVHLLADNRQLIFNDPLWAYADLKDNYAGGAAPTVTDDETDGYSAGSKWYDTSVSPMEVYICTDATTGAAVWALITVDTADLGTMAVQDVDAVNITGGDAVFDTLDFTDPAIVRVNLFPSFIGQAGKAVVVNGTEDDVTFATLATGTVTSVQVSGGTTGLTFTGGPITTNGTITVGGTLAEANGGTGITALGTGVATALGLAVTGSGGSVQKTGATVEGLILHNGYTEEVFALGTSGSLALEPDNGSIQTCALTGNPTFTDGLAAGQSVILMLTNGASYAVTWPTITWVTAAGNVAPALTAADTLVFWKVGSTLYGAYVGSYV